MQRFVHFLSSRGWDRLLIPTCDHSVAELVLPQSPSLDERVIKCSEQKDAARARKLAIKQIEKGRLDKAEGCARAVIRFHLFSHKLAA